MDSYTQPIRSFTITQAFLGAPLQFTPALGSKELDQLIDALVLGNGPRADKLSEVTIDFYNNATVDLNNGALVKTYNVFPIFEQSPTQSYSSGASPAIYPPSPASSGSLSFGTTLPARLSANRVSKKSVKKLAKKVPETRLPGFSIMTRDGVDVTSTAGRGTKTKEQREHAHLMRIMKACDACKKKKIRCDPSHRRSNTEMSRSFTSDTVKTAASSSSTRAGPSPSSSTSSSCGSSISRPSSFTQSSSQNSTSPINTIDDFVLFPEDTLSWNSEDFGMLEETDLGQFNFDINELVDLPQLNVPPQQSLSQSFVNVPPFTSDWKQQRDFTDFGDYLQADPWSLDPQSSPPSTHSQSQLASSALGFGSDGGITIENSPLFGEIHMDGQHVSRIKPGIATNGTGQLLDDPSLRMRTSSKIKTQESVASAELSGSVQVGALGSSNNSFYVPGYYSDDHLSPYSSMTSSASTPQSGVDGLETTTLQSPSSSYHDGQHSRTSITASSTPMSSGSLQNFAEFAKTPGCDSSFYSTASGLVPPLFAIKSSPDSSATLVDRGQHSSEQLPHPTGVSATAAIVSTLCESPKVDSPLVNSSGYLTTSQDIAVVARKRFASIPGASSIASGVSDPSTLSSPSQELLPQIYDTDKAAIMVAGQGITCTLAFVGSGSLSISNSSVAGRLEYPQEAVSKLQRLESLESQSIGLRAIVQPKHLLLQTAAVATSKTSLRHPADALASTTSLARLASSSQSLTIEPGANTPANTEPLMSLVPVTPTAAYTSASSSGFILAITALMNVMMSLGSLILVALSLSLANNISLLALWTKSSIALASCLSSTFRMTGRKNGFKSQARHANLLRLRV